MLWAAASFLPRQIEHLHRLGGERYFQDLKDNQPENSTAPKSNRIPSDLMVLWIMINAGIQKSRRGGPPELLPGAMGTQIYFRLHH